MFAWSGEIAGDPQPRPRGRCEVGSVDSDGEMFAFNADIASRGLQPRDRVALHRAQPRGRSDRRAPSRRALGYGESLTTVRNTCENLDSSVRVALLPKIPVEESA